MDTYCLVRDPYLSHWLADKLNSAVMVTDPLAENASCWKRLLSLCGALLQPDGTADAESLLDQVRVDHTELLSLDSNGRKLPHQQHQDWAQPLEFVLDELTGPATSKADKVSLHWLDNLCYASVPPALGVG